MPVGVTLDHTCKTRQCVNPDHLRVLPNYENARRVNGMDWPMGQCANGHPNSLVVTRSALDKRGNIREGTICAECRRLYLARANWRKRHPGEPLPEHLHIESDRHPYMCDPDCGFEGEVHLDRGRGRCPSCDQSIYIPDEGSK